MTYEIIFTGFGAETPFSGNLKYRGVHVLKQKSCYYNKNVKFLTVRSF